jgi:hypothetical protein
MRFTLLVLAVVGSVAIGLTSSLDAQLVSGQVVDSLSRAALGASFVVLLDASGVEVDRELTGSAGAFTLRAPGPGSYRLRSERIGYRVAVSPPIEVPAHGTVSYTFEIAPVAVVLSAVEVRSETECALNPERAQATLLVWEEVRKALAATAWDGSQERAQYRKYNYERDLTANRRRVIREEGKVVEGVADQPYTSLPAGRLAREGYIVSASLDQLHYALPDANVLLDDSFLSTHCFHVVRDARQRPGEVGLAFVPVKGRNVTDVRGALWLDENTSELETLEASYTRLPAGLEDERAGGTVAFLRLPSGAWIVQRWELRTPKVHMRRSDVGIPGLAARPRATVAGWRDFGGEILEVETADGTTRYPASLGHVTGTLYDSTRSAPLGGATVALAGTPFSSVTDTAGAFHIAVPLKGEYALALSHPWLDSIAYQFERTVEVTRGSTRTVALAIPHARSWLVRLCPDAPDTLETGAVVGVVRGATGEPVADATVQAAWQTITRELGAFVGTDLQGRTTTDDRGRYVLCQMPTGWAIAVRAYRDGDSSRAAHMMLPTSARPGVSFAWDHHQPGTAYTYVFDRTAPLWKVDFVLDAGRSVPRNPPEESGRLDVLR